MKKWMWIVWVALLLTGCGARETMETLGQVEHFGQQQAAQRQILLDLPESATLEAANQDSGVTVYHCDGFLLVLQNSPSGDLVGSVQAASGFDPAQLTFVETACGDHTRYDWVWTAASGEGELVCRGALLDDGDYHYCLCAIAPTGEASALSQQWNSLFASFCLETQ